MGAACEDAINQLRILIEQVEDEKLLRSLKIIHQGYPDEALIRFLVAREWNIQAAHEMLLFCLKWRVDNEIDHILAKPISPADVFRSVRDTQLIGLSGFSKQGQPVFAVGVGMSTYDRASIHYYLQSHIQINEYRDRVVLPAATKKQGTYVGTCLKVLDMTGLRISSLAQIKVMDYSSLPHFCRKEGSGSSRHSATGIQSCYSADHEFHQQLYAYVKEQFSRENPVGPIPQESFHVDLPLADSDELTMERAIESGLQKYGGQKRVNHSTERVRISD